MLKVKLLHRTSKMPVRSKDGDAGIDLFAHSLEFVSSTLVKYSTGIAVEIPENHVGLIFQRSSSVKKAIRLTNCAGVIDSNYRGEILVYFTIATAARGNTKNLYYIGDRIAQMVIVPCPKLEIVNATELSTTNRGTEGFGSSGQ